MNLSKNPSYLMNLLKWHKQKSPGYTALGLLPIHISSVPESSKVISKFQVLGEDRITVSVKHVVMQGYDPHCENY